MATLRLTDTSRQRQLERYRDSLVALAYLRHGVVWESIVEIRNRWNVTPTTGVYRRGAELEPREVDQDDDQFQRWHDDLRKLHDAIVPPVMWVNGSSDDSCTAWRYVLSGMVWFDPPGDALLDYAASLRFPETVIVHDGMIQLADGHTSAVFAAIDPEWLDAQDSMTVAPVTIHVVGERQHDWRQTMLVAERAIEAGRANPEGDPTELARHVIRSVNLEMDIDEVMNLRHIPCIVVDDMTSEDDVRRAFRLIRNARPTQNRKPPRNPLVSLQASEWADCGITESQIAERLGKSVSSDEYGRRRRSTSARDHVRDGRLLRADPSSINAHIEDEFEPLRPSIAVVLPELFETETQEE